MLSMHSMHPLDTRQDLGLSWVQLHRVNQPQDSPERLRTPDQIPIIVLAAMADERLVRVHGNETALIIANMIIYLGLLDRNV